MLTRLCRALLVGGAACLAAPATAQFTTLVTNFEVPAWDFQTEILFLNPANSTSTTGLSPTDGNSSYISVAGLDPFVVVSSGTRAAAVFWGFTNPGDPSSWVRLSTFNAREIPNPAVHLEGKVRFRLAARAFTSNTFATQVPTGKLHLGIGLRESGQGVRLGGNGGTAGDVEQVLDSRLPLIFAGTNGLCDTTIAPDSDDVQLVPVGSPATPGQSVVGPGPDGILQTTAQGDDVLRITPIGLYEIPTDGVMRLYEFDLAALQASENIFGLTGDGDLGATPNNRGTLDHLVLTNDPGNGAVNAKVFYLSIDDVEFVSPVLDPPAIVTNPVAPQPLAEVVTVQFVKEAATLVEIVRLDSAQVVGSIVPQGATIVDVPTTPLPPRVSIVARQTVGGSVSDNSVAVPIVSPGNGPLRIAMAIRETAQYDNGLNCGDDGTGFDPDQPSTLEFIGSQTQQGFGVPTPPRFVPSPEWFEVTFDPCDEVYGVAQFSGNGVIDLRPAPEHTNGVWEGLYFRIDAQNPTVGPFTVYLDDLAVKDRNGNLICLVDDFESYDAGDYIIDRILNGNGMADTVAAATDIQVVPVGSPTFPGQIIVAPGPDGTLETIPQGDDIIQPLHARFSFPGVSGTSIGLAATPNRTAVTTEDAFSGSQALRIDFAFLSASNLSSVLRLTTNGSLATNPPEPFVNPDSVIPLSLDGTLCDNPNNLVYSVMVRLAPPPVPADCDSDGTVDMFDVACLQLCFRESPLSGGCAIFDIAPNGAPDGVVNALDFQLFTFLLVGP